jgi:hypothetical protein
MITHRIVLMPMLRFPAMEELPAKWFAAVRCGCRNDGAEFPSPPEVGEALGCFE